MPESAASTGEAVLPRGAIRRSGVSSRYVPDGPLVLDGVALLAGGKVVQVGRHHQLMAEPGPFRELTRRQTPA